MDKISCEEAVHLFDYDMLKNRSTAALVDKVGFEDNIDIVGQVIDKLNISVSEKAQKSISFEG